MKRTLQLLTLLLIISCSKNEVRKETFNFETEEFSKLDLPFSQAVKYGNILYVSGQIGDLVSTGQLVKGGIVPETKQTMLNIKNILEANGSSMDKIIKCTCMLADIKDWEDMSKEYMKFFPKHKPARSAFATNGLALNAKVEIECMVLSIKIDSKCSVRKIKHNKH